MESWVQRWLLRLPWKIDARSYEVLHLSRKIILANLQIWCSKMQPLSGNQRPDLLTSLMNMSFVLRLPREMHLCRSSSNVPRLPSFLEMLQNPDVLLTFEKVHNPWRLPRATTSERPKVVGTPGVFSILTSKCALRHNGAHFFDISTSKSGPTWCALHFFVQKWSGPFALYILTSKCASRHNISTSKSGPTLRCFVHFDFDMWFALQRRAIFHLSSGQMAPHPPLQRTYFSTLRSHKSLEKHSVSRLSYLFAHLHLLSSDVFSSLIFSLLLFSLTLPISSSHLSILSEVWLLNFLQSINESVTKRWTNEWIEGWVGCMDGLMSELLFFAGLLLRWRTSSHFFAEAPLLPATSSLSSHLSGLLLLWAASQLQ